MSAQLPRKGWKERLEELKNSGWGWLASSALFLINNWAAISWVATGLLVITTVVWSFLASLGPLVIPFGLVTLLVCIVIIVYIRALVTPAPSHNLPPVTAPAPDSKRELEQNVFIYRITVQQQASDSENPYLLFHCFGFNGAPFPIRVTKTHGHTRRYEQEISGNAELFGDADKIEHGHFRFAVRQWLTPALGREILTAPWHQKGRFKFDTVHVSIAPFDNPSTEHRLSIPDIDMLQGWYVAWRKEFGHE